MIETSTIDVAPVATPFRSYRIIGASALGTVAGASTIAGMWLPLVTVGGFGPVGFFDYNRPRAYACVALAGLVAVGSLARCFRTVLLLTGILCGLQTSTGIEVYAALRDALGAGGGDLPQMAQQMIAHSSLLSGAYLVPLCCLACIVAGALGSSRARVARTTTSGS